MRFCIAVIIEVIGSITVVDTNVVKRILPYIVYGLQPNVKVEPDHKVSIIFYFSSTTVMLFGRLV